METNDVYPVASLDITVENPAVLTYIKTLLKQMKGVRSVKVTRKPKIEMTEEEYRTKIENSASQFDEGKYVAMNPDESGMDFINRVLCTK